MSVLDPRGEQTYVARSWRIITCLHQPYSNRGKSVHNFLKKCNSKVFEELWAADLIRIAVEPLHQHCPSCKCRTDTSLPQWTFSHNSISNLKVVKINQAWQGQLFDVIEAGHGISFPKLPESQCGYGTTEESSLSPVRRGGQVREDIGWGSVDLQETGSQSSTQIPVYPISQELRESSQKRSVVWRKSPARSKGYLRERKRKSSRYDKSQSAWDSPVRSKSRCTVKPGARTATPAPRYSRAQRSRSHSTSKSFTARTDRKQRTPSRSRSPHRSGRCSRQRGSRSRTSTSPWRRPRHSEPVRPKVDKYQTNVRKEAISGSRQLTRSRLTPNKDTPVGLETPAPHQESLAWGKNCEKVQSGNALKKPNKKPFDTAEAKEIARHGIIAGNSEVRITKHSFVKATGPVPRTEPVRKVHDSTTPRTLVVELETADVSVVPSGPSKHQLQNRLLEDLDAEYGSPIDIEFCETESVGGDINPDILDQPDEDSPEPEDVKVIVKPPAPNNIGDKPASEECRNSQLVHTSDAEPRSHSEVKLLLENPCFNDEPEDAEEIRAKDEVIIEDICVIVEPDDSPLKLMKSFPRPEDITTLEKVARRIYKSK